MRLKALPLLPCTKESILLPGWLPPCSEVCQLAVSFPSSSSTQYPELLQALSVEAKSEVGEGGGGREWDLLPLKNQPAS